RSQRGSLNVRFSPFATEIVRRCNTTRRAISDILQMQKSSESFRRRTTVKEVTEIQFEVCYPAFRFGRP
ncbi:MAG: hypothetical protein WBE57_12660, partial [Xanthobacteraceae bacterium]